MKKLLPALSLLLALLLAASACGKKKPADETTGAAETDAIVGETTAAQTDAPEEPIPTEGPTDAEEPRTSETQPAPQETTTMAAETAAEAGTDEPATQAVVSGASVTSKGYAITQSGGITYVDGVMIANKTYTLPKDYAPGDLTSDTYAAFYKMQSAASADGISLFILSGYRSYELQTTLYNRYVASDGKAAADRYSARPGHSEHQTGYAMDLNSLSQSFADTAEGKWIAAHSYEYGFILRYPQGKEDVTGYMYEPWHLRYLGVEKATAIYNSGLTLEEYYGITSEYAA